MRGSNSYKHYGKNARAQPVATRHIYRLPFKVLGNIKIRLCNAFDNSDSEEKTITNNSSGFSQTKQEQFHCRQLNYNLEERIITTTEMKRGDNN
jgi:hypothetical protein